MGDPIQLYLAVDPGAVTGYVLATCLDREVQVLAQSEAPMDDFLDWAEPLLAREAECVPPTWVICESYDITPATLKKSRGENWSLEQIGILRRHCRNQGIPFKLQRPSDVIRVVPDYRLEAFGLNKRGGAGHWRDAGRHLLYFLAKNGKVDLPI